MCAHIKGTDPREMIQHGSILRVSIKAVAADGTHLKEQEGGAIIDTGAEVSCVSPAMFEKLSDGAEGTRNIAHVYGNVASEKTVRASVSWMQGVEFTRDFALLDHLKTYYVLIGRDVLKGVPFLYRSGSGAILAL